MSNDHWDTIYTTRPDQELGWYEPIPSTFDDVVELATETSASVIDVGAGTGRLIDELVAVGYGDLTVLDISAAALEATRRRLAGSPNISRGEQQDLRFVEGDVTSFEPDRTWDLWHDRAVFHFLVEEEDREGYVSSLCRSVGPGGRAVIATFAEAGPDSCAGLPVRRYSEHALAAEFDGVLNCLGCRTTAAVGATDTDQRPYTICRFEKR